MTDVRMTDEAAARINNRFDDLAAEFHNTTDELSTIVSDIDAGAGEFVGSISSATSAFSLSWREAFDVCGKASAIIAGNTNRLSIDLTVLDRDASTTIEL
ncbi:MAG: hypothetical protein HOQ22_02975 [Nocardioidaceae bacterium]|nr:hypothetical protein [Nocardioidaceae bacterium]NUS49988.1 hypothetical protein [Nocardioidaceae bacterium]